MTFVALSYIIFHLVNYTNKQSIHIESFKDITFATRMGWGGNLGRWGCTGEWKKKFKHGHVTGDLGVRSKGKISLNFGYHVNFNFLYQTLLVFSQIKDRKHIEQNFHSVAGIMPQGWDLGVMEGGQNFSVGICDGALSTARSSYIFHHKIYCRCSMIPFFWASEPQDKFNG